MTEPDGALESWLNMEGGRFRVSNYNSRTTDDWAGIYVKSPYDSPYISTRDDPYSGFSGKDMVEYITDFYGNNDPLFSATSDPVWMLHFALKQYGYGLLDPEERVRRCPMRVRTDRCRNCGAPRSSEGE
jgi:hypothetical protein